MHKGTDKENDCRAAISNEVVVFGKILDCTRPIPYSIGPKHHPGGLLDFRIMIADGGVSLLHAT